MSEFTEVLITAIESDDESRIHELLRDHPELKTHTTETFGRPVNLVSYAARNHKSLAVRSLLKAGCEVNDPDSNPFAFTTIEIMELLYSSGGVVERAAKGYHPIQAACEDLDTGKLKWLLDHGANPSNADHPLELVTHTYSRNENQKAMADLLISGGIESEDTPVMDMHRGRLDLIREKVRSRPSLITDRFDNLATDIYPVGGSWGGASLHRTSLLHACVEFGELEAVQLAVDLGADLDARGEPDGDGFGNQTPIFHAVTSFQNVSFPVLEWLISKGADLSATANLRVPPFWSDMDRGDVLMENVTPLGYALAYPNYHYRSEYREPTSPFQNVVDLLRSHGAAE